MNYLCLSPLPRPRQVVCGFSESATLVWISSGPVVVVAVALFYTLAVASPVAGPLLTSSAAD